MLSSAWNTVRLGDFCTKIGSGATPRGGSSAYLQEGPYSLIRSQNVLLNGFSNDGLAFISDEQANELRNVEVLQQDVLLNITGDSVARACLVDTQVLPARVNQHVAIVRPHPEEIDPRFLLYWLVSPETQSHLLTIAGGGATRNALTKGMIEGLQIKKPPLSTQQMIATVLGALDDKIELNRRMNETLEAMARALFRSWFVDFDPVRAKSEGRPTGLPADLDALFPSEFEDSPLGEIPRGWTRGNFGDEFHLLMGQSPPGETYNSVGDGLPFFQGKTDFGFRFPSNRVYCNAPTRIAELGQILISVRAPVGDINVALEKSAIGRGVAAAMHKSQSASYSLHTLAQLKSQFQVYDGEGTVFGAINKSDFQKLSVVVPPKELVTEFEGLCRPLDASVLSNECEIRQLAMTRDELLPKLLSGEIEVAEEVANA